MHDIPTSIIGARILFILRESIKEQEKLRELDDLKAASPIFGLLKYEVIKWEWGQDFDEYTISIYICPDKYDKDINKIIS